MITPIPAAEVIAEQWSPVPGWEGSYEVSDHGRVRSVERVIRRRNGTDYTVRERILRPKVHRGGWRSVCLARDGAQYTYYTHSLVDAVWAA